MKPTTGLNIVTTIVVLSFLLLFHNGVIAQKSKVLTLSATAMGTFYQGGRIVNIDLSVTQSSSPTDQKALLEAFREGGSEGLVNALEKMGSKGRIANTGTLGFDLKYVRIFKMPDGSLNIRFVTDRPITFAERWASARSMDYSLAMGEIFIKTGKDKSSGTLVPASRLKLNDKGEVQIDALQNTWKLTNIRVWK